MIAVAARAKTESLIGKLPLVNVLKNALKYFSFRLRNASENTVLNASENTVLAVTLSGT